MLREVNLREVYAGEDFLSETVLQRYKLQGIEEVMMGLGTSPILGEIAHCPIGEIILITNGSHRTRALYDLGKDIFQAEIVEGEQMTIVPTKISDLPVFPQGEYNRRYEETIGEPAEKEWR